MMVFAAPVAAAAVAKGAAKAAKKVWSIKPVRILIIVLIAWLFLRRPVKKFFKKIREKKFDKAEHKDVNQLAQSYRAASNPSGISWMIDFDGTDEDAIEILARQTKGSLEEVASAYRQKFDEALTDRLRKELDSDDFQKWRDIVT